MAYIGPSLNLQLNNGINAGGSSFIPFINSAGFATLALVGLDSGTYLIDHGTGGSSLYDVALGSSTLDEFHGNTTGSNVAVGGLALTNLVTGYGNTAIGPMNYGTSEGAGNNYTSSESNNILISNIGTTGDNNIIRIGTQGSGSFEQNSCYIAGIYNTSVGGTNQPMTIDNTGKLGAGNNLTVPGNILLPNTNSAGTQGVIEFNSIRFIHNIGTENTFLGSAAGNLSLTGTKNLGLGYEVLGSSTGGSNNIALGYQALDSIGTSASGNIAIGNSTGGNSTGNTNIYLGHSAGSVYTGTENNNILIGNTGQVGDSGQVYIGTESTHTNVTISGLTNVDSLNVGFTNSSGTLGTIFLSTAPYIYCMLDNTNDATNFVAGPGAGYANNGAVFQITGGNNTFIGQDSGLATFNTSNSTYIGSSSGLQNDGDENVMIGSDAGFQMQSGTNNILIGYEAATNYGNAESSNIVLGNAGVTNENNVIRIGTQGSSAGQQNACYIAGIYGGTVGLTHSPVLIDSTGLLGTLTSSRRFKDNIEDMEDESSSVLDLRPVTFTWKKDPHQAKQYGLIAEEVEDVFPELVNYDDQGNPFSVKYHDLVPMLLNEIQKLSHRVDENEETIRNLKEGKRVCQCSK